MSSHQQTRRVCREVSAQYSKAPKSSSLTTRIESQSLHQALRGEALPWSPKRDYREGTKIREESKHPSGDSRASNGTIRQAFATRDSHQCVLHWWQRGLSSRKHDRPLKAQVLQRHRFSRAPVLYSGKGALFSSLEAGFPWKRETLFQLLISNGKS